MENTMIFVSFQQFGMVQRASNRGDQRLDKISQTFGGKVQEYRTPVLARRTTI